VIAFSGGVDSSLLLKVAKDVLRDRVVAVTAVSSLYPKDELFTAKKIAREINCPHIIIETCELDDPQFVQNPRNRCYYCKIELFKTLIRIANKYGYVVVEASNKSDLSDYRPGIIAAKKLVIKSPLIDAGLEKKEIRALARKLGLPNWNKPSMACLASRIPYGRMIDRKTLKRVGSAEGYLKKLKLSQVRVRDHYPIARIEVLNDEIKKILNNRERIVKYFRRLSYKYISLDLEGYQTGSLNR